MPVIEARREVLRPLVSAWIGKIQEAAKSKKQFADTAEQCHAFFAGSCGFMWEPKFLQKFVGGALNPKFKITIAKAFELVALFGPTLYWRNPTRMVKPRASIQLDPQLFGGIDPTGYMLYQQMAMEQQQRTAADKAVASLLELYLNYTPIEQPHGGLATHASDAITEALVRGRGCLWPMPYSMPGSDRVLTGCFFDNVENLLIDPDATSLQDARWIAQKCTHPIYEVERQFQLPPGSLAGKGSYESGNAQGTSRDNQESQIERRVGKSFDLITYYKIWSKGGIGARLSGSQRMDDQLARALEETVGDYAYVVVAPSVPWPLNAPSEVVQSATDAELQSRFRWPVPFWMDDRWPVAVLDFYRNPGSPWPIAPMAPGLGELAYMNILMSQLANHIWNACRTMIGADKNLPQDVEAQVRGGGDLVFVKYDTTMYEKLDKALSYVQLPTLNPDVWQMLDRTAMQFDRRVGLTELLYGLNPGGVQSRTAEDIATKREMVSIRPDYMAGRVEDWQTQVAEMEKMCARTFVRGNDLRGMFGQAEQFLWDQYVGGQDLEFIAREMRATIAANSTRKPDKARDTQNMQQLLPALLPVLQGYFQMSGNPEPLNALIMQWGKTIDQDMSGLLLPPPQPQEGPSPEQQAAEAEMLQQQQLHEARLSMDQERHGMQMQQGRQKSMQDAMMAAIKMRGMEQQMKLRAQAAKRKPKARAA